MGDERNYEVEAREMGHCGKDEWKGDQEKWVDAKTFVERGENFVPFLKKRLQETEEDLKASIQLNKQEIDQVRKESEARGYEAAKAKYRDKLEALDRDEVVAFKEGDEDKYLQIKKEKEKLKQPTEPKKSTDNTNKPTHEFVEWHKSNKWYGVEQDESMFADAIAVKMAKENPNMSTSEVLEAVSKKIKTKFPTLFMNELRDRKSNVSSGGDSISSLHSGKPKSFNDLPATAKDAYKKQARRFKSFGKEFTKDQYYNLYVKD